MGWVMADELGMVVASAVATAVAFIPYLGVVNSPGAHALFLADGHGISFGYGAGVLNTWVTLPRGCLTLPTSWEWTRACCHAGLERSWCHRLCSISWGDI